MNPWIFGINTNGKFSTTLNQEYAQDALATGFEVRVMPEDRYRHRNLTSRWSWDDFKGESVNVVKMTSVSTEVRV